jgi:uncharacterized membrane protein
MMSLPKIRRKQILFLLLILSVAGFLRLPFWNWSLSNDELSAVYGLSLGSFSETIGNYVYNDMHPAGVQVFLYLWCKLFGIGTFALRLPFFLMSLASLVLLFFSVRSLFSVQSAWLVISILSVTELHALYSQIARPYAFGMFSMILMFYGFCEIIGAERKKTSYLWFFLGMLLSMYNHYFSFLGAAILGLYTLMLCGKEQRKKVFLSGLFAILCFLPHLSLSIAQFSRGGLGTWLAKPDKHFFSDFFLSLSGGSLFLLILFIINIIYFFISAGFFRRLNLLLIGLFVIPALIGYFYSIYINPVLQPSILLFGLPFLLVGFLGGQPKFSEKQSMLLSTVILFAGLISMKVLKPFHAGEKFATFSGIANLFERDYKKYGQNAAYTMNIVNPFYLDYYLKPHGISIPFKAWSNRGREELSRFDSILKNSKEDVFIYGWTNADNPSEIPEMIREHYPHLIERHFLYNAEYYVFSREAGENTEIQKTRLLLPADLEQTDSLNGRECAILRPDQEFSKALEVPLRSACEQSSDLIHASVVVNMPDIDSSAMLIVSIDGADGNVFWGGMPLYFFRSTDTAWFKVFYSIRLPELYTSDLNLKVYLAHEKGKSAFAYHSLQLKVSDGNEGIYGLRKDRELFTEEP